MWDDSAVPPPPASLETLEAVGLEDAASLCRSRMWAARLSVRAMMAVLNALRVYSRHSRVSLGVSLLSCRHEREAASSQSMLAVAEGEEEGVAADIACPRTLCSIRPAVASALSLLPRSGVGTQAGGEAAEGGGGRRGSSCGSAPIFQPTPA